MDLDKHPLPKPQAALLALRSYSALTQFQRGEASFEDWRAVKLALNVVNALMCLGKPVDGITSEVLKLSYVGLRDVRFGAESCELDFSFLEPLGRIVRCYDSALQNRARKTMNEATRFVDRCLSEQADMDLESWFAHFPYPPMVAERIYSTSS